VLRVLESTGLGALVGCAAGGGLIPLLLWRGVSTFPPTVAAVALGGLTGLLWSLTRRPTRLRAAVEADRQLGLSDLLATAVMVGTRPRESDRDADAAPWLRTVLAAADESCRRHAPAEVILRRLGGRAWGGIALAAALVMTLAALTAQEPAARASATVAARPAPGGGAKFDPAPAAQRTVAGARTPDRSRSPGTGPESESERAPTGTESARVGSATSSASNPGKAPGSPGDAGTGAGAGRARTPSSGEQTMRPAPPSASRQPGDGAAGSGAGQSATRPAPGDTVTAGTVTPDGSRAPGRAPWESPEWSGNASRARDAVESQQVPDSRRELIRAYFERS
jgi:hypothetical protein